MAPLIPHGIINPELTLFFALIVGIGFGYVLEQAGFSSAKKLAGVFYGYDFVVLRVFFTAGITAMTGLLFFNYLGWVDMTMVFINPTFLYSAITGGVIMGFGFIMGGYCPGTSIVAAVTGKIDAMLFIIGMFAGIFLFGHFYDLFEPLYNSHFLGNIFVYDSLGMSRSWFALILVITALLAFAITQLIEDKINKTSPEKIRTRPSYVLPAMLLIVSMIVFLFLPVERKSRPGERAPDVLLAEIHDEKTYVSTHRVIHEIKNGHNNLVLIDVRDKAEYDRFTLPGAVSIRPDAIPDRQWRTLFKKDQRDKVFFGNGNSKAVMAYLAASRAGYERIYLMDGGLNAMFGELFADEQIPDTTAYDLQNRSTARFLNSARQFFLEGGVAAKQLEEKPRIQAPEESEVIPVIGGC